jgi:hypothetical protein
MMSPSKNEVSEEDWEEGPENQGGCEAEQRQPDE